MKQTDEFKNTRSRAVGSQLTFMTQHEKVMIFRHVGGVTTDLLDV